MKNFKFCVAFFAFLAGCQGHSYGVEKASQLQADHQHGNATAAVHGMVLFGTDTLFASHIPMFSVPHDWQALFEVELSHLSADAKAIYLAAAQNGLQALVTLKPQPFVLPKLLSGEITTFEASIYKGNFEQGGPVLLTNVQVKVKAVMYKQHLSPMTPALAELTYLPVTMNGLTYLVHKISAPDNFDHVVQVEWKSANQADTDQDSVASVVFTGKADLLSEKLKAGQIFELEQGSEGLKAIEVTAANADAAAMTFKVISDFYCTPGPDFFGACK